MMIMRGDIVFARPHAAKGQRTLFYMGCTSWKLKESIGLPKELSTRLDPKLACKPDNILPPAPGCGQVQNLACGPGTTSSQGD
eukprot:scaffold116792_cov17-Tisochrysis_lutea.AAC.2